MINGKVVPIRAVIKRAGFRFKMRDEMVTCARERSRRDSTTVRSPHLPDPAPKAALALSTSKNWPQTALGILLYGPQ
jgi:hypothetical protein